MDQNLRPYYDPETFNAGYEVVYQPNYGVVDSHGRSIASKLSIASTKTKVPTFGVASIISPSKNKKSYSDLEFQEYFEVSNMKTMVSSLWSSFVRSYSRHLISQPFEVARLLLQVGSFSAQEGTLLELEPELEEEEEEVEYFVKKPQSNDNGSGENTRTEAAAPADLRRSKRVSRMGRSSRKVKRWTGILVPESLSTSDVLSSIMSVEGVRGIWRGNHASFVYNALSTTLEAWFTGLLSPFLGIPDPYFIDITHSPDPTRTLLLSLGAGIITTVLLCPLDIIKTKLIVTKVANSERSVREMMRKWNFKMVPLDILVQSVLYNLSCNVFKKCTPYLLFVKFGIDRFGSPFIYSTFELVSRVMELFVRLPLETLLRRCQVAFITDVDSIFYTSADELLVRPVDYTGSWPAIRAAWKEPQSLFMGWKIGLLKVAGSWGLRFIEVTETKEDHF